MADSSLGVVERAEDDLVVLKRREYRDWHDAALSWCKHRAEQERQLYGEARGYQIDEIATRLLAIPLVEATLKTIRAPATNHARGGDNDILKVFYALCPRGWRETVLPQIVRARDDFAWGSLKAGSSVASLTDEEHKKAPIWKRYTRHELHAAMVWLMDFEAALLTTENDGQVEEAEAERRLFEERGRNGRE